MIPVTKPFLPPKKEYEAMTQNIWDEHWLTNNGPLSIKLEMALKDLLNLNNMFYVTNGTIALHIAIRALELSGEIITTPFSFVATTTSIIWENCKPVYVDILPDTLCINPAKIEKAITKKTCAILATHVYGVPCDVEKIDAIAKKYNLKVIYDAAHAFGVKYKDKSILKYGDISTLSFHATKVFHTVEGGGIVSNREDEINDRIRLLRNFGFEGVDYNLVGINGKNSEIHAAMGLCNLKYIETNLAKRKRIANLYNSLLKLDIQVISFKDYITYNFAYYPILLENEQILKDVVVFLLENNISTRRYFFPSLNKLNYIAEKNNCPISEDISKRVLCIPLYSDLPLEMAQKIAECINIIVER